MAGLSSDQGGCVGVKVDGKAKKIAKNVKRIKKMVKWFPGVEMSLGRQAGKTQAILEMIHEQKYGLSGRAIYFAPNVQHADLARQRYDEMYSLTVARASGCPIFTSRVEALFGNDLPIYVDEPWMLSSIVREQFALYNSRIVCALGSYGYV